MVLTFRSPGEIHSIEAPQGVEINGRELRLANQPEAIAYLDLAHWRHAHKRWSSVECRANVWLHFLDDVARPGLICGPLTSVHLRGHYLFAGRQRAAKFAPLTSRWIRHGSHESWPVLRILPQSGWR